MKIRFNHWWFRIFPGAGVVLYPYVLFKRPPDETPIRLFRHELQHVYQVRREGWWKFYLTYLWYLLRYGYRNNPYEVEARAVQEDPLTAEESAWLNSAASRFHENRK